jgi:molybdenum cofactor biosynthesis protein B
VTLSDTRTEATDKSGRRIKELLSEAGHEPAVYQILPDDPDKLNDLLANLLQQESLDLVVTNGGTGISARDNTVPIIHRHVKTLLPGFGELFRMLSFQEIGSAAMLSRAIGGTNGRKLLFALPGSTAAVELAMTKLILPELGHLLAELRKGGEELEKNKPQR